MQMQRRPAPMPPPAPSKHSRRRPAPMPPPQPIPTAGEPRPQPRQMPRGPQRQPIDPNLPPDTPLEPGSGAPRIKPGSAAARIAASEAALGNARPMARGIRRQIGRHRRRTQCREGGLSRYAGEGAEVARPQAAQMVQVAVQEEGGRGRFRRSRSSRRRLRRRPCCAMPAPMPPDARADAEDACIGAVDDAVCDAFDCPRRWIRRRHGRRTAVARQENSETAEDAADRGQRRDHRRRRGADRDGAACSRTRRPRRRATPSKDQSKSPATTEPKSQRSVDHAEPADAGAGRHLAGRRRQPIPSRPTRSAATRRSSILRP